MKYDKFKMFTSKASINLIVSSFSSITSRGQLEHRAAAYYRMATTDEARAKGVPPPPSIDRQITVFPNFSQIQRRRGRSWRRSRRTRRGGGEVIEEEEGQLENELKEEKIRIAAKKISQEAFRY